MFRGKTVYLALSLVFYSGLSVFGQWSGAKSGTNNNLNGGYLLDSGVGSWWATPVLSSRPRMPV